MKRTMIIASACIQAFSIIFLSAGIDSAKAVTLPMSYEGTVHFEVSTTGIPGSKAFIAGSCEGDAKIKVTLYANGIVTGSTDAIISIPGPPGTACEIVSVDDLGWTWRIFEGTHDKTSTFSVKIGEVTVTGTFNDQAIFGTGTATYSNMTETYTFELPAVAKCPTNQKIPLPTGQNYFVHEAPAVPGLGLGAAAMKPFAVGAVASNPKGTATLKLGFCPFDGPVDIYVAYVDSVFQVYLLGADGRVKDADNFQAWRTSVTGSVNAALGDFGGLFPDPGKLPKGGNSFFILVTRSGSPSDFYLWGASADVSCPDPFPSLPEGPNFYYQPPVAVPVYSSDPAKMNPLALGPAAIGGKTAAVHADFCNFGNVDTHFMVYCADDPSAFNFLNFSGRENEKEKVAIEDFFEGVQISSFAGFPAPFARSDLFEEAHNTPDVFFIGPVTDLPKPVCLYLVAIAPPNSPSPAVKFYAWYTIVDFDIRLATLYYWWNNLHPPATADTEARMQHAGSAVSGLLGQKK